MFLSPEGRHFLGHVLPQRGTTRLPGFSSPSPRRCRVSRSGRPIAEHGARLRERSPVWSPRRPARGGECRRRARSRAGRPEAALRRGARDSARRPVPHASDLELSQRTCADERCRCWRDRARYAWANGRRRHPRQLAADSAATASMRSGRSRIRKDALLQRALLALYAMRPALGRFAVRGRRARLVRWMTRECAPPTARFFQSRPDMRRGGKILRLVARRGSLAPATDSYAVAAPRYGLDRAPISGPRMEFMQRRHRRHCRPLAIPEHEALARLAAAKATLFDARARRIRPGSMTRS